MVCARCSRPGPPPAGGWGGQRGVVGGRAPLSPVQRPVRPSPPQTQSCDPVCCGLTQAARGAPRKAAACVPRRHLLQALLRCTNCCDRVAPQHPAVVTRGSRSRPRSRVCSRRVRRRLSAVGRRIPVHRDPLVFAGNPRTERPGLRKVMRPRVAGGTVALSTVSPRLWRWAPNHASKRSVARAHAEGESRSRHHLCTPPMAAPRARGLGTSAWTAACLWLCATAARLADGQSMHYLAH